ncbi:uncharacterized protein LOC132536978 [Erinaceus europaeus]|uniref:Uncharacterized protein LOC132536978 n=1 Tax=Erinaceus europaeus TaxID=9365 RepID=A0ABM3X0T1_ERIEU|nr:uncharacterized protein LOC132536978 [Erinaceus europaeus]
MVNGKGQVIWSQALPPGTSAQKAELIALTEALRKAEGKKLTVYTDSRYVFATAHVHGAIYLERGLFTAEGREIKNEKEILDLLEAVMLPSKLTIIHCPGHQKGEDPMAKGNQAANQVAREAAKEKSVLVLQGPGTRELPPQPEYDEEDLQWIQAQGKTEEINSWTYSKEPWSILLPKTLGQHLLQKHHSSTHLGVKKMTQLLQNADLRFRDSCKEAEEIVRTCRACQTMQQSSAQKIIGTRIRGDRLGMMWEVDFTEVHGLTPWVHYSHSKKASPEHIPGWMVEQDPEKPLRVHLKKKT